MNQPKNGNPTPHNQANGTLVDFVAFARCQRELTLRRSGDFHAYQGEYQERVAYDKYHTKIVPSPKPQDASLLPESP